MHNVQISGIARSKLGLQGFRQRKRTIRIHDNIIIELGSGKLFSGLHFIRKRIGYNAVAERGALLGNEVLRQADGYAIHRKTNGSRINYLRSSRHALHGRFFYLAANDIHHAACAGFAETGNSIGKLFRCACSEYIAVSQFTHISAWTNGLEYNGTVILRFVSINYYLA